MILFCPKCQKNVIPRLTLVASNKVQPRTMVETWEEESEDFIQRITHKEFTCPNCGITLWKPKEVKNNDDG